MDLETIKVGDITTWPSAADIAAADRPQLRLWLNGLPGATQPHQRSAMTAIIGCLAAFAKADKQPRILSIPASATQSAPTPSVPPLKPKSPPEPPPLTTADFLTSLRS